MDTRMAKIKEVNQYFVKLADSCPLVIEDARKKKLMNAKKPISEQERQVMRQQLAKKQQFLDKIGKEFKEKERIA